MIIFLTKSQLDLFRIPVHVEEHVRRDGTVVHAHMATRRKRVEQAAASRVMPGGKLGQFISKHGGPERLRSSLSEMTAEQRAKLIDAMAHLGGIEPAEMMRVLGIHGEEQPTPPAAIHQEEPPKPEEQAAPAPASEPAQATTTTTTTTTEAGPQEGDTKTEDGIEYVLRDGRWHRSTPEEKPEAEASAAAEEPSQPEAAAAGEPAAKPHDLAIELAEDRADLADEMLRDPHSERAKELVRRIAEKEANPIDTHAFDEDNPDSPNYRFRDTGYIAGSRKEEAVQRIKRAARDGARVRATDIDWDELEQNPREAAELIRKSNLFGAVDWAALREDGMEPGAGYLIDRVYASVGTEPADDPRARRDYALGLESLRDRLERCKTAAEITDALATIKDEMLGVMLEARESEEYQAAKDEANRLWDAARGAREESDAVYQAWNHAQSELRGVEYEREKRARRKWKPDPELDRQVGELRRRVDETHAAFMAYRDAHPELQSQKRDLGGGAMAFDNELEWAARQARNRADFILQAAKARNLRENPVTRAWLALGERFHRVLNWRSYKGSDAFAEHVTAAKNGKIADWSWAEKETIAKPLATKREVGFQLKVAENFERIGGRPVVASSTAVLKEMFGLRDVQSGNWVLQDVSSASWHVQRCAEALSDLADLLGVPDQQVSVNGRLAIAFGARGKGNAGWRGAARAHYEPVHRVVNLTKMGGGGALGHELFHGIDNMMKEAAGAGPAGADEYVTEQPDLLPAGELRDAVLALRGAMLDGEHRLSEKLSYSARQYRTAKYNIERPVNTISKMIHDAPDAAAAVLAVDSYYRGRYKPEDLEGKGRLAKQYREWRTLAVAYHDGKPDGNDVKLPVGAPRSSFAYEATLLDGGEYASYWSQTRELAARAFQAWCEDRLAAQDRRNDYLSAMADNRFYVDSIFGPKKPFPEGDERMRINAAIDRLVEAMRRDGTLAKALGLLVAV